MTLIFCYACATSLVQAQSTYYVATNGNNNNDGKSLSAPWRSINYAAQQVQAGDVVLIKGGTYQERVLLTTSGTATNKIVFRAADGETPIIDGANLSFSDNNRRGIFEINSARHIRLEGLSVINATGLGLNGCAILVNGPSASHITINDCYTENTPSSGIAAWGNTGASVYNGVTDLIIENSTVVGALDGGYQEHITIADGVENYEVRYNVVRDGQVPNPVNYPIGIDSKIDVRNGKVYGNEVYNLQSSNGIYVDAWDDAAYNIEIYDNIVYDVDGTGIQVGGEQGGDAYGITIYNNVIYSTGADGLKVNGAVGDVAVDPDVYDISLYNNTVYQCRSGIWVQGNTGTVEVFNNIFSSNNLNNGIYIYASNAANVSPTNNLIDAYVGRTWNDPVMEEIRGANAVEQAPLFVDAANADFRLQSTSPAIDAGIASGAPATDFAGNARPVGAGYDIGAYEQQGGTTPPPPVAGYCASKGNSTEDEWIAEVVIGPFTNTSGNEGGYGDFTNQSITLEQGQTYAVNLTPGYAGTEYKEYWKIYADLNQDEDFADSGELLFDAGQEQTGPISGSLTIPATASLGATRLRVVMKYTDAADNDPAAAEACGSYGFGETEDYTLTVTEPASVASELPSPWQSQDIGAVATSGSASFASGTFSVEASGADIWNNADEFHYVYQPLSGDGEIVARVNSLQNTNAWAKAGVMIRESLAANAKHAFTAATAANGMVFQRRSSTAGSSSSTKSSGSTPYWVRLSRSGDTFSSAISSNGTSWTTIGTATISMATQVYVGLAVTSHNDGTLTTAQFTQVEVGTTSGNTAGVAQQDSGPDGLVVIEAEAYESTTPQGGRQWVEATAPGGYTGSGFMQATPDQGTLNNTGYVTNSPELAYRINFVKTGTHYLWLRTYKTSGTDDSFHAGLDGSGVSTADRIQGEDSSNSWQWSGKDMEGQRVRISVNSTGKHTLNLWMREDGARVDKIVLTTSSSYTPSGSGPANARTYATAKNDALPNPLAEGALISGNEDITVFPNPSSGIVKVSIPQWDEAMVTVFDTSGKEVLQKLAKDQQTELDLRDYRGLYLIEVQTEQSRTIKKVMVE